MAALADRDLRACLRKVIDELNLTADQGVSLTPAVIRNVTATLETILACHLSTGRFEEIAGDNVVPISRHSVKV